MSMSKHSTNSKKQVKKGGYLVNEPPLNHSSGKNNHLRKSVIKGRMVKSLSDCGCGEKKRRKTTKKENEIALLPHEQEKLELNSILEENVQPFETRKHSLFNEGEEVIKKFPYQMKNIEQTEYNQSPAMRDKSLNKYHSNIKLFLDSIKKKLFNLFPFKNNQ